MTGTIQLTLPTDEAGLNRLAHLAGTLAAYPAEVGTILAALAVELRKDDPDAVKIEASFERLFRDLAIALPMGAELQALVTVPGSGGRVQ